MRLRPVRAFTPIELLVVVAIIALLTSILMPSLQTARDKAKQAKCLTRIRNLNAALEGYAKDQHGYLPRAYQYNIDKPPTDPDICGRMFLWYWFDVLYSYVDHTESFLCPSRPTMPSNWWGIEFRQGNYGVNVELVGEQDNLYHIEQVKDPANTQTFFDSGLAWMANQHASEKFRDGHGHFWLPGVYEDQYVYASSVDYLQDDASYGRHAGEVNFGYLDGGVRMMTGESLQKFYGSGSEWGTLFKGLRLEN